MQLDDKGDHQVRTHAGRMAFRFDEKGAPTQLRVLTGQSLVETVLIAAEAFGGPGFPLPAAKLARIAEVAAGAETEGEEDPADAGGDPETDGDEPPSEGDG